MFFKESKYGCSVSQTADWDNFYAIRPRVCKLAAGNDHQQIRFAEIRFAGSICSTHKLLDLKKMLCAFFNFTAAELKFNQSIPTIGQMEYTVRFQIRTVVVIRNLAAEGRRVNLQIPDAETLKNETERFQVLLQILRY